MPRGKRRKPSPERKRIAELEEKLFTMEKLLAYRNREIDTLCETLAESRKGAIASRWQLRCLQRIVFASEPVEERQP